METVQAFTLLAAAIIFGICGAGTAVAFGNLGGKPSSSWLLRS
jgi:F-type H+-transporting ATPase subunit c